MKASLKVGDTGVVYGAPCREYVIDRLMTVQGIKRAMVYSTATQFKAITLLNVRLEQFTKDGD